MSKKFLLSLIFAILFSFGISSAIYADPPPIGNLENREETESTAGITWDEINEMSQNSPNALTPIQGLVLWMFAILAFLKLAQKMDNLLQQLGLNVTQTGGRAVGDLIMAGMALKHVGGAISRGMGMFGFGSGGAGGGSGSSSGSGGGSGVGAGSRGGGASASSGSTPIPASGPSGSPLPGGTSSGGRSHSGTPPGSTPSAGSPSGRAPTSPSSASAPSSSTPGGSSPSVGRRNPSGGVPPESESGRSANSRNPVAKAADWIREDGFAQGAIKATAKGGLIGAGAYATKTGVSKLKDVVSENIGGDNNRLSVDEHSPRRDEHRGGFENNRPYIDSGAHGETGTNVGFGIRKNPEEFHDAMLNDDVDAHGHIPPSVNDEDFVDSGAYTHLQEGIYSEVAESGAIPAHSNGHDSENVDVDSIVNDSNTANPVDTAVSGAWRDSKSIIGSNEVVTNPATTNTEVWRGAGTHEDICSPAGASNEKLSPPPILGGCETTSAQPTATDSSMPANPKHVQTEATPGGENIESHSAQYDSDSSLGTRVDSSPIANENVATVSEFPVVHIDTSEGDNTSNAYNDFSDSGEHSESHGVNPVPAGITTQPTSDNSISQHPEHTSHDTGEPAHQTPANNDTTIHSATSSQLVNDEQSQAIQVSQPDDHTAHNVIVANVQSADKAESANQPRASTSPPPSPQAKPQVISQSDTQTGHMENHDHGHSRNPNITAAEQPRAASKNDAASRPAAKSKAKVNATKVRKKR